ncbi:MAG: hypothetical protein LH624_03350, partial [Cryobacterium sp.]|nr:hypothetical protein [Cryobacterium sp.]
MKMLESAYLIDVRPRHRETADSYTRRLLTANTDTTDHQTYLISLATASKKAAERERAWRDIMVTKTKRDTLHLDPHETAWLTHQDGTSCEHCATLLSRRWMCTLCAGGEHIHQHPHFDALVCLQHRRWVGLDTPPAEQHQISDDHLEAALTFRKLRRKHLLDVRLFTALMTAVRLDTDKDTQDSRPSASFPLAVETARIITSEQFGHKFYNPATTMKEAYRFLNETVHSTLGYPGPATTRTIWLCAHPTVYAIRRHLTTRSPFT